MLLGIDKFLKPLHEHVEVVVRLEEADPRVPAARLILDAGARDDIRLQQRLVAVSVFLPLALHPRVGCFVQSPAVSAVVCMQVIISIGFHSNLQM